MYNPYEKILSSIESKNPVDMSTLTKLLPKVKPDHTEQYRQCEKLLTACLKTGDNTTMATFLPHYYTILSYSNSHNDINNTIVSIKHTKNVILAMVSGHIKTAILLMRNATYLGDKSNTHTKYCSDVIFDRDNNRGIPMDDTTIAKYKSVNKVSETLSDLFSVISYRDAHKLCVCESNIHEYNCMYNPIDCPRCYNVLKSNKFENHADLNYVFSRHGHVKPIDCYNIIPDTYEIQLKKIIHSHLPPGRQVNTALAPLRIPASETLAEIRSSEDPPYKDMTRSEQSYAYPDPNSSDDETECVEYGDRPNYKLEQ